MLTVHPLLPSTEKEVLQEEMNCIPKSWVCTLLCSSNSDPDPGAHGKCLVLGEVYLTPVCWTKSSGIGLVAVP